MPLFLCAPSVVHFDLVTNPGLMFPTAVATGQSQEVNQESEVESFEQ